MDLPNQQQSGGGGGAVASSSGNGGLVPDVSNGQLPDESTIEKLFPKCPPKQLQQGRKDNFRQNRSSFRQNGARHQQKRQNRIRLQQQRQEISVNTKAVTPATTGPQTNASNSCTNLEDNKNFTRVSKLRDREYFNSSSDSSDKETSNSNAKIGYAASNMRRAVSNHYGFDTNNNNPDETNHDQMQPPISTSKQRTRKYTASKNLQKQLQRSHSGYKQDPRSSPPNSNSRPTGDQVDKNTISASSNQSNQQLTLIASSNGKSPSSSIYPYSSSLTIKDNGRVSRTCRGIVFAEPQPSPSSINTDIGETNDEGSLLQASNLKGEVILTHTSGAAPKMQSSKMSELTQVAQGQARACCQTADPGACKTDVVKQEPQLPGAIAESNRRTSNLFEHDTAYIEQLIEQPDNASPSNVTDNIAETEKDAIPAGGSLKDEDKYINLFVYENATPSRQLNDSVTFTKDFEPPTSPSKHHGSQPPSHQEERHQLLAGDLSENEQDVIRNDTSVEELCGFDYEADTGRKEGIKETPIKEKTSNNEPEVDGTIALTKPHQKYHRSIGTLQTVDEKAEIYVDDTPTGANGSSFDEHSSKNELIDITENNIMFDEESFKIVREGPGLTPPGFPRRIRTTPAPSTHKTVDSPKQIASAAQDFLLSPTGVSYHNVDKIESNAPSVSGAKLLEQLNLATAVSEDTTTPSARGVDNNLDLNPTESSLSQSMNKVALISDEEVETSQNISPRQHHKLPNESSHFSISRTTFSKPQDQESRLPNSKLQFNTLSDADSEPDAQPNIELNLGLSDKASRPKTFTEKKQESTLTSRPESSSQTNGILDDDLAPAGKTALVFPRLDEGLSSEAESCDDDEVEDDDRAMEADVDADDDEDDDDDDDDDDDGDDDIVSSTLSNDKSAMNSSMEPFLRLNQGQMSKPQNRMIGSLQQQQTSPMALASAELHQNKPVSSSTYANFDVVDQNDLKPNPNYQNQNGQANYWTGSPTQPALSNQPSSAQSQFTTQRSQQGNNNNGYNMNMNVARPNNYANRDEAKSVNRLSSDTDNETDRLLGSQRNDQLQKMNNSELNSNSSASDRQNANNFAGRQSNSREVLIEGVLFSVKYLGATQTECEGRGEKEDRIHQAELAVHEVKFRNGDGQPAAEVQLFISTEKIMVLDDKHRKIMMDHSLRTISYIADIGDAFVLIVRKKNTSMDVNNELGKPLSKTSCYVFESNESHTITKSISQAFHVAFTELMKANGTGDGNSYLPKELDYQEVLNSQEMSLTELEMFARKDNQREVIVPKQKGEILGISIVESGWGSVLPTAVIAGLMQDGPAYRCKKLSVGDQILSINGNSLVGLSLAECQKILRKTKRQTVARLSVVPCPITVEVKIKRPDTKYQLGFSVQHGVICSLLRGGIAERGGVRVGHRIISINGTTVVGVPHDKIVTLLASSVGEIRMQTCLTSLYRHMLGEEKNVSFV